MSKTQVHPELPLRALSIMQPWAWLIVNGHKDIENRIWPTKVRGLVAIHSGKKLDVDCEYALTCHDGPRHPVTGRPFSIDTGSRLCGSDSLFASFSPPSWHGFTGGIVGVAEIVDCIPHGAADMQDENSEWFVGPYGFVIRNARPVDFIACRGQQGFFEWRQGLAVQP